MGFNPRQPRNKDGEWTSGGGGSRGGYGPGQKLKNTHKSSEGSIADRKAALAKAQIFAGDRWSKLPSTAKANLTAGAQFSTKVKPGKTGKLPTLGKTEPRMIATPFKPSEPDVKAVAIQTAKNLDKDFRSARDRANKEAMKAAVARSNAPVTRYPEGKRPKIK